MKSKEIFAKVSEQGEQSFGGEVHQGVKSALSGLGDLAVRTGKAAIDPETYKGAGKDLTKGVEKAIKDPKGAALSAAQTVDDALRAGVNFATLGYADKLAAKAEELRTGKDYETALKGEYAKSGEAMTRSPTASKVGQVAGAVGSIPFGLGAAAGVKGAAMAAPKIAQLATKAMPGVAASKAATTAGKVGRTGAMLGTGIYGGVAGDIAAKKAAAKDDPENPYLPYMENNRDKIMKSKDILEANPATVSRVVGGEKAAAKASGGAAKAGDLAGALKARSQTPTYKGEPVKGTGEPPKTSSTPGAAAKEKQPPASTPSKPAVWRQGGGVGSKPRALQKPRVGTEKPAPVKTEPDLAKQYVDTNKPATLTTKGERVPPQIAAKIEKDAAAAANAGKVEKGAATTAKASEPLSRTKTAAAAAGGGALIGAGVMDMLRDKDKVVPQVPADNDTRPSKPYPSDAKPAPNPAPSGRTDTRPDARPATTPQDIVVPSPSDQDTVVPSSRDSDTWMRKAPGPIDWEATAARERLKGSDALNRSLAGATAPGPGYSSEPADEKELSQWYQRDGTGDNDRQGPADKELPPIDDRSINAEPMTRSVKPEEDPRYKRGTVSTRSPDEIEWASKQPMGGAGKEYPGPGWQEREKAQGEKNWNAIKNFFGFGKKGETNESLNENDLGEYKDLVHIAKLAGHLKTNESVEKTMSKDFREMLEFINEASKMADIKGKKHSGSYGKEYDTDEEGDEKTSKKAEPAAKQGRGRPKKDSTVDAGKWKGADDAAKHIIGGKAPKGKSNLPSKKHTLKDWINYTEQSINESYEVQSIIEGMDPRKKARLKELISDFESATDPNSLDYDDYAEAPEILNQIRIEFGDKIADQVEAGEEKMHFGRPDHDYSGYDDLKHKFKARITKAGKMHKQDIETRKDDIKQKFNLEEKAKNKYAIGMAAAKKQAGYGSKPATDLPKSVIKKGHEIAKKIKEENYTVNNKPVSKSEYDAHMKAAGHSVKEGVSIDDRIENLKAAIKSETPRSVPGEDHTEQYARHAKKIEGYKAELKKLVAQKKQGVAEGVYKKDVERAFPASGVKTGPSAPKGTSTMPKDKEKAKGAPAVKEELKGGQKKLDKNNNGQLDSQDFKMLRSGKKKVKEGVNYSQMMRETQMSIEEMLMELQSHIEEYKNTGHMSEELRDALDLHKYSKKDKIMGESPTVASMPVVEEPVAEGPFAWAAKQAKEQGKDVFKFGGETHPVTVKEADPQRPKGDTGIADIYTADKGNPPSPNEGPVAQTKPAAPKQPAPKPMKESTDMDKQMESWDSALSALLNENITINTSTGTEGNDSVTVTATEGDAAEMLAILRNAGMAGIFGDSQQADTSPYGAPMDGENAGVEMVSVDGPEVIDGGDSVLELIKKMTGIEAGHPQQSSDDDYRDEGPSEEHGEEEQGYDHEDEEEDQGEEGSDYEDSEGEEKVDEVYGQADEGNMFTGNLAKARAAGKEEADLDGDGDMEKVHEGEGVCNECGMSESSCGCEHVDESLEEAFANEPNEAMQDIEFMTRFISGGLNREKRDQTTLPHTSVKLRESTDPIDQWKFLSGIK